MLTTTYLNNNNDDYDFDDDIFNNYNLTKPIYAISGLDSINLKIGTVF